MGFYDFTGWHKCFNTKFQNRNIYECVYAFKYTYVGPSS